MLGTHPSYNGKGIASMLLKWGLDRADNDGMPVFLSASPAGKPMYERRGFRVVQEEEVAGGGMCRRIWLGINTQSTTDLYSIEE